MKPALRDVLRFGNVQDLRSSHLYLTGISRQATSSSNQHHWQGRRLRSCFLHGGWKGGGGLACWHGVLQSSRGRRKGPGHNSFGRIFVRSDDGGDVGWGETLHLSTTLIGAPPVPPQPPLHGGDEGQGPSTLHQHCGCLSVSDG